MMQEKNEEVRNKRKERVGFYVALGVCVAAIGIAAVSTFDAVSGMLEPAAGTPESSRPVSSPVPSPAAPPVEPDDDPEETVSAGHAAQTAPAVEVKPQTESPSEDPVPPLWTEPAAQDAAADMEPYVPSEQFAFPLSGRKVLQPYSQAPVYAETMRDYRAHLGADYAAEQGETIRAVGNGKVLATYTDMLLGNVIEVEHGHCVVRYCGVGENYLVDPGEVVRAGQDLGCVTAVPFETAMAPHLHLEITENGQTMDPEGYFA